MFLCGRSMSLGFTTPTRVCTLLRWTKSKDEDVARVNAETCMNRTPAQECAAREASTTTTSARSVSECATAAAESKSTVAEYHPAQVIEPRASNAAACREAGEGHNHRLANYTHTPLVP